MLIKLDIFEYFDSKVIDKALDGILSVKFQHKLTDFTFVVMCCYLPPKNSVWGRDSDKFYSHLTNALYTYSDVDSLILCGDFNARISSQSDVISEIDQNVPPRVSIDKTLNSHGVSLLEFLKDNKYCIVNGRISPKNDNYTFISQRGKSVVDYFITSHDGLKFCENFKVFATNDLVDSLQLEGLLGTNCKSPDHSMLVLTCKFSYACQFNKITVNSQQNQVEVPELPLQKVFSFSTVPNMFMNNESWKSQVVSTIERLQIMSVNQSTLDVGIRTFVKRCSLRWIVIFNVRQYIVKKFVKV